MSDKEEDDKVPLLPAKPVRLNYTKRYDQVSWHSADTDFEPDPSAASADERRKKKIKKSVYSNRRKRKIAALVAVVVIFLSVMSGLIYVYLKQSDEFVEISCGKVSGDKETLTSNGIEKTFYIYKGIPFAEPPVKQNRWKSPVKLSNKCWKDILKAKSFKSLCVGGFKKSFFGSEDCLYLDVYTPQAPTDKGLLPVIVLLNSEISSMNLKSNKRLPSSEFISDMETILVNVNFRRDLFGFFSTEEIFNVTGNYGNNGIADQILALQWVQKEIEQFGGNPKDVTIFSGTSGYALLASPKAKGLFCKMFVFGASPNFEATFQDAFSQNKEILSECKSSNYSLLISCLDKLSAREIQETFYSNHSNSRWELPNGKKTEDALIIIEPKYMPFSPDSLSKLNQTVHIPVMVGHSAQETGLLSETHPKNWNELHDSLSMRLGKINSSLTDYILEHLYTNQSEKRMSTDVLYQTITSDIRVLCPTISLKREMSKSKNHIFYQYVLESSNHNRAVVHGEDITAIFTMDKHDLLYHVGQRLRSNLKHFIKYGHPNEFEWESNKVGLFKTNDEFQVVQNYHEKQCDFFNQPEQNLIRFSWRN